MHPRLSHTHASPPGPLPHHAFSDPMRDYNGKGTQSWYNNDDLHFKEENSPTFTAKGDNNENRCVLYHSHLKWPPPTPFF